MCLMAAYSVFRRDTVLQGSLYHERSWRVLASHCFERNCFHTATRLPMVLSDAAQLLVVTEPKDLTGAQWDWWIPLKESSD
jgi:hypothetical protein